MRIESFPPMPTRPAKYCLSLQEDSVFADFDFGPNGGLYLARISFDGYGCCKPTSCLAELNSEITRFLVQHFENGNVETPQVESILRSYFNENKALLWEDALEHHDLI